jgi:hypothetical protein
MSVPPEVRSAYWITQAQPLVRHALIRSISQRAKEFGPDDAVVIPPGHDAWTVGDEPCIMLDFAGADEYAAGARSQS